MSAYNSSSFFSYHKKHSYTPDPSPRLHLPAPIRFLVFFLDLLLFSSSFQTKLFIRYNSRRWLLLLCVQRSAHTPCGEKHFQVFCLFQGGFHPERTAAGGMSEIYDGLTFTCCVCIQSSCVHTRMIFAASLLKEKRERERRAKARDVCVKVNTHRVFHSSENDESLLYSPLDTSHGKYTTTTPVVNKMKRNVPSHSLSSTENACQSSNNKKKKKKKKTK